MVGSKSRRSYEGGEGIELTDLGWMSFWLRQGRGGWESHVHACCPGGRQGHLGRHDVPREQR